MRIKRFVPIAAALGITVASIGNAAAQNTPQNTVKIGMVMPMASTSTLVEKSPYFVRTSCTIAQSSTIIAEWAIKNGLTKIVTLVSDFSPGHEAEAIFKSSYLAAGGQIAESIRVPLQSPDFAPS